MVYERGEKSSGGKGLKESHQHFTWDCMGANNLEIGGCCCGATLQNVQMLHVYSTKKNHQSAWEITWVFCNALFIKQTFKSNYYTVPFKTKTNKQNYKTKQKKNRPIARKMQSTNLKTDICVDTENM